VAAWFEGPNFTSFVRSSRHVRSGEAWLACASCLELVHADDRAALAARAANRARSSDGDVTRSELDERFWDPRDRALNNE
jgi:hypothetical protein